MKTLEYTVTDALGIHARPAGALAKEVKRFQSRVAIQKGDREAEASRLMALMGLGVKCGDRILVKVEGEDEEAAAAAVEAFLQANL